MKKKSVWVANDGTEFESQDEALLYERDRLFSGRMIEFFAKHTGLPEDETINLLHPMRPLLNIIRDHAHEFQEVVDAGKPKARRGRPPKQTPTNQNESQQLYSTIFDLNKVEEVETELVSDSPGEWRSYIPKRGK